MVNVLKFRTHVSDKMAYANCVDPDQSALESDQGLQCCHSTKYLKKQLHKKQNLGKKKKKKK